MDMIQAVRAAIVSWNPNEEINEIALAKAVRYHIVRGFAVQDILDAEVKDDEVFTIYYAYRIDTEQGPIS